MNIREPKIYELHLRRASAWCNLLTPKNSVRFIMPRLSTSQVRLTKALKLIRNEASVRLNANDLHSASILQQYAIGIAQLMANDAVASETLFEPPGQTVSSFVKPSHTSNKPARLPTTAEMTPPPDVTPKQVNAYWAYNMARSERSLPPITWAEFEPLPEAYDEAAFIPPMSASDDDAEAYAYDCDQREEALTWSQFLRERQQS